MQIHNSLKQLHHHNFLKQPHNHSFRATPHQFCEMLDPTNFPCIIRVKNPSLNLLNGLNDHFLFQLNFPTSQPNLPWGGPTQLQQVNALACYLRYRTSQLRRECSRDVSRDWRTCLRVYIAPSDTFDKLGTPQIFSRRRVPCQVA